ncbi:MAG: hypothetical protein K8S20_15570 [Chloroflexi bacterium]|nr:hypothetical protein [Chloroflexota bacterium]
MTKRKITKLIHVGEYAAEVSVELIYTDDEWSPYLSLEDANKLDDIREALQHKDFKTAQKLARVYALSPLAT